MSLALPATHTTSDARQTTRTSPANDPHHAEAQSHFSQEERRQFAADDADAGRHIGKILASLFIYTLIAMSIATWWTFRTVR